MRKHQFVKVNCNCLRRATHFKCKHCGTMEYKSQAEVQALPLTQAECDSPAAPNPTAQEKFKSMLGGAFDCLAMDFESYAQEHPEFGIGAE